MTRESVKALNPAVARVLKRMRYPLDVILTCVRWYVAYPAPIGTRLRPGVTLRNRSLKTEYQRR
jgi:transposase-like protein